MGDSGSQVSAAEGGNGKFQETLQVVATLIITLTYQGLLNPPSTLFKHGNEIGWECFVINSHIRDKTSILNTLKYCPSILAFMFLTTNTLIFLQSIYVLDSTLRGRPHVFPLRVLTVLLAFSYSTLLMAFSYNTAYFALALSFLAAIYLFYIIQKEVRSENWQKLKESFWNIFPKKGGGSN